MATAVLATAGLATAVLASCAAPASATLPPRPDIPDGWVQVQADTGDLRMALPDDVVVYDTAGGIMANQRPDADGQIPVGLWARGPASMEPQPAPGTSIERWLAEWLQGSMGRTPHTPFELRSELLPAGRATVLTTTGAPGGRKEHDLVIYAIPSPGGVALLVFSGTPEGMSARVAEIALMAQLVELGPGPAAAGRIGKAGTATTGPIPLKAIDPRLKAPASSP